MNAKALLWDEKYQCYQLFFKIIYLKSGSFFLESKKNTFLSKKKPKKSIENNFFGGFCYFYEHIYYH